MIPPSDLSRKCTLACPFITGLALATLAIDRSFFVVRFALIVFRMSRSNVCYDFAKGHCRFGSRCRFAHDAASGPAPAAASLGSQQVSPSTRLLNGSCIERYWNESFTRLSLFPSISMFDVLKAGGVCCDISTLSANFFSRTRRVQTGS